ncbi:MAG: terminase large subunit domain-containing protein [Alphaproteobacteria bacterium]
MSKNKQKIIWAPQKGPQTALLSCSAHEIFYGGARGGGKTDAVLGEFAVHAARYGNKARGLMLRREYEQLKPTIKRAAEIYQPLGAIWKESAREWLFMNGATLKMAYLDHDQDASKYQGHSYTRIYVEELTNFPDPEPLIKLKACLRSAASVPCRFIATGNPGGVGHQWVKERYIDPFPQGFQIIREVIAARELTRVYIPAKLSDNSVLMRSDPDYELRLRQSGSAALVKAWLEGDWDVVEGAYFDGWHAARHVVRPISLPAHWLRFRAFDWGFARPFCCLWLAVSDGELKQFPAGSLVVYREWYGAIKANIGLRLTAEAVATGIAERELLEKVHYGVADPAMFAADGGPSIAERMAKSGVLFRPADNKRLTGWDNVRARLLGDEDGAMLYVFSSCVHLIRTLPALQHDSARAEDVNSDSEDHAADALRYACMSRPWIRQATNFLPSALSLGGLWKNGLINETERI